MAARKSGKKAKKTAKRSTKAARKPAKRPARKAAKKKSAARRPARRAAAPARRAAAPAWSRIGVITHTELASADPSATQQWCEQVLGWKFMEPMQTPSGLYRMWRFVNETGGGIRSNNPPEVPGSIPYVEVAEIRPAFSKALEAGATEMYPPSEIPGGMGWIAIVAAPGGVAVGFWAPK